MTELTPQTKQVSQYDIEDVVAFYDLPLTDVLEESISGINQGLERGSLSPQEASELLQVTIIAITLGHHYGIEAEAGSPQTPENKERLAAMRQQARERQ